MSSGIAFVNYTKSYKFLANKSATFLAEDVILMSPCVKLQVAIANAA